MLPHLNDTKLKEIIKRYRLEQIENKLNSFNKLPYPLQTKPYNDILIKNKLSLSDTTLSEFTHKLYLPTLEFPTINFTGLILGIDGRTLRLIEQETKSRIFIRGLQKNQESEPIHCHIISDDTQSLKRAKNILTGIIEEAIFARKEPQETLINTNTEELSDWSKFYMWWYYHNMDKA